MPRPTKQPQRHGKRWRIRWTDHEGKRRYASFARREDAILALRRKQAEVEEVRRGLRQSLVEDRSVADLCDYWLDKRAPRKRSRKDMESMIRRHLRPAFGSLRLIDLGPQHIDGYVEERDDLDPKTIANHLTLLKTMLRLAVDLGWLAKSPRIEKPKTDPFSKDFSYLRTDDEVRRFLAAARSEGEMVFLLYATAVYTGMRAGELAGLRWTDVDLDRRLITVQRSYDGPTKSDRVRHVPVLDPLLPVLRSWRLRHAGHLVFTNRDGGMLQPSARIFQEVLHRVLDRAGLKGQVRKGRRRPYVTFHGLRHTFASRWVMHGGDLFRLKKILGHSTIQVTERYAHLAPDLFSQDHGRLGTTIPGGEAAVVALPSAG